MRKLRWLAAFLTLIAGIELFNKGLWLMNLDSDLALYGGMAICGLVLLFVVEVLEFILHGRKKKNEKSGGVNAVNAVGGGIAGMCNEDRSGVCGDRSKSSGVTEGSPRFHA